MNRQNLIQKLVARKMQTNANAICFNAAGRQVLCFNAASRQALCLPQGQPKK